MNSGFQHYQVIDDFFDAYSLSHARQILRTIIKTADTQKTWKSPCPANAIYFTKRLQLLLEAVFSITEQYDYRKEIVLDKTGLDESLMLTRHDTYCGWHSRSTPWDFFPRHLSAKEFTDPYKALKKFTRYRSLREWKETLEKLCFHALSPNSINEFDDGTSLIGTWLHLHKILEATHLIEVRYPDKETEPRKKWKHKQPSPKEEETNNEP